MQKFVLDLQFFAHKKGGGSASTNCNHDSRSKRLGLKAAGGELVRAGNILVRQKGTKYRAGPNVYSGKDYTLHAAFAGVVRYFQKKIKHTKRTFVEVLKNGALEKDTNGNTNR